MESRIELNADAQCTQMSPYNTQDIWVRLVGGIPADFLVAILDRSYVGVNHWRQLREESTTSLCHFLQMLVNLVISKSYPKMNKAGLSWNSWFQVFSFYLGGSSVIIFYRNDLFWLNLTHCWSIVSCFVDSEIHIFFLHPLTSLK